jgi:hypothetical protein
MFLVYKVHSVKKNYWESKELEVKFIFNGEFGEASAEVLETKDIVCKLDIGKYSAQWVYKGLVDYTSFPESDYTSELKEQLSELFPFDIPVVFDNGEFPEE